MTRLRLDAALYYPAPERQAKQMGRPRKVGKRLPTLKALINNPYTPWHTVVVKDWYGHGDYALEIVSHTAVWYHTGLPAVPIRWVLLKDPKGQFPPQALLCTDTSAQPSQTLHWFRQRWQLEVTFEEVRAHLGVETRAAMVSSSYSPNHTCSIGLVLNRSDVSSSGATSASFCSSQSSLVSEAATNFC